MLVLNVEPSWVSPYVFSCFVTLREKSLAFDTRALDSSRDETRTDEHLGRTITGRVPSLQHDDFAMAESSAIVEYLDETFPDPPVLPRETRARARCRQLMSWLRSDDTAALREERPTLTMFFAPAEEPLGPSAAAAARKLCEVAERVGAAPGKHLFGAWSIADAELAFMLHRLICSGDAVPEAVRAWAKEQWARPSVRAFVERERPAPPRG